MTVLRKEGAQSRHVLGLDIIRFIAAVMVMMFHYGYEPGRFRLPDYNPGYSLPYAWAGWVGVQVFFVISGFVISYSTEAATPASFLRSRIVRLMPAVWICGSLTALVAAFYGLYPDLAARYLATLVLWPTGPWIDSVYWTLPVEIGFYTLVLLTLFGGRGLSLPVVLQVIALASSAFWLGHLLLQFVPNVPLLAPLINQMPGRVATALMLNYGVFFATGGILWLCLRQGWTLWRAGVIGLCLAAGAIQILFSASPMAPVDVLFTPPQSLAWIPHGQKLLPAMVWLGLVGAIVASVLANTVAWRLFGRWANTIRYIGLATYPLYLLHDVLGSVLMSVLRGSTVWLIMAVMIGLSFIVAIYAEPPVQKWLRSQPIWNWRLSRLTK